MIPDDFDVIVSITDENSRARVYDAADCIQQAEFESCGRNYSEFKRNRSALSSLHNEGGADTTNSPEIKPDALLVASIGYQIETLDRPVANGARPDRIAAFADDSLLVDRRAAYGIQFFRPLRAEANSSIEGDCHYRTTATCCTRSPSGLSVKLMVSERETMLSPSMNMRPP